ncbi:hypothetical protein MKX01_032064 [Papaver californicum]|nr:hypothetical protein MKX01_032064 [Papaver californicum]
MVFGLLLQHMRRSQGHPSKSNGPNNGQNASEWTRMELKTPEDIVNVMDKELEGIIERDAVIGLYGGLLPNGLKNLPNSIRITTFGTVRSLITSHQKELERIVEENPEKQN